MCMHTGCTHSVHRVCAVTQHFPRRDSHDMPEDVTQTIEAAIDSGAPRLPAVQSIHHRDP